LECSEKSTGTRIVSNRGMVVLLFFGYTCLPKHQACHLRSTQERGERVRWDNLPRLGAQRNS